mgnify:CR=1 FL=1
MIRSRGIRSWGISRSGLVGGLVFGVLGDTLVLDIGDVSGVVIGDGVGHDLSATVRKSDAVFAVGGVSVTGLVGSEVHAGVSVLDGVFVGVGGGNVGVGGLVIGGGRGVGRGRVVGSRGVGGAVVSHGDGGESENDESLKYKIVKSYANRKTMEFL